MRVDTRAWSWVFAMLIMLLCMVTPHSHADSATAAAIAMSQPVDDVHHHDSEHSCDTPTVQPQSSLPAPPARLPVTSSPQFGPPDAAPDRRRAPAAHLPAGQGLLDLLCKART
ncbi:hypothetical protein ACIBH1_42015 [Nonomuraea sp. NPDC050663]|uniref:hypothetical protein n=1 Tax=Nonomuraea sp. NPDC050663 TaxID=3364370 RepID=UPI0037AD35EC